MTGVETCALPIFVNFDVNIMVYMHDENYAERDGLHNLFVSACAKRNSLKNQDIPLEKIMADIICECLEKKKK